MGNYFLDTQYDRTSFLAYVLSDLKKIVSKNPKMLMIDP